MVTLNTMLSFIKNTLIKTIFFKSTMYLLLLSMFIIVNSQHIYEVKQKYPGKKAVSNYTRNRLLETNHFELTSLYGDSEYLNYYYLDVFLGKNKDRSTLIVDTGSSIMCLTCTSTCKNCGKHENPNFRTELSDTFKTISCNDKTCSPFPNYKSCRNNQCGFSISYGEGSKYTGYVVEDLLIFGDDTHNGDQRIFPFGCVDFENNLFFTQPANGILGLAPTGQKKAAFISLAKEKGLINKEIFSLCFSQSGGYITLGSSTNAYHKNSKISYIPYIQSNMYKIKFNSYKFSNEAESNKISNSYYTVIDSGTTLTYFPKALNSDIFKKLSAYCKEKDCKSNYYNGCFSLKSGVTKQALEESLPSIAFNLGENNETAEMIWTPNNYLIVDDYDKNKFCIGVYAWNSSEIILGGTWMHNQDIIFDVENQRIGIVESDCGKFNADKKNNSSNSNNSQISSQQSSGLKSDSQESNSEVSSASDKTKSDSDIISENTSQSIEIKSENSSESDNSSLIQIDGYILDISKLTNKSSLKATQLYLIEKSHNSTNIESKISENSAKTANSNISSTNSTINNDIILNTVNCLIKKVRDADYHSYETLLLIIDIILVLASIFMIIGSFFFKYGYNFLCFKLIRNPYFQATDLNMSQDNTQV